jgi:RHS repeat-associated protein
LWQNPNEFRRIIGDIECVPTFLAPDGATVRAASLIGNDILWQSMRWDAEVGLYDMRNRWYDPYLGRFLIPDPLGAFGAPLNFGNATTFPANNPWSYRDPWGMGGWWLVVGSGHSRLGECPGLPPFVLTSPGHEVRFWGLLPGHLVPSSI